MSVALVVTTSQSGQLYYIPTVEAAVTKPDAFLRIHGKRWGAVLVVGQWATSYPLATDATEAARAAEPICQVYDLDGLFGGVNRLRVGDAPISPGASLSVSVYNHVYILL